MYLKLYLFSVNNFILKYVIQVHRNGNFMKMVREYIFYLLAWFIELKKIFRIYFDQLRSSFQNKAMHLDMWTSKMCWVPHWLSTKKQLLFILSRLIHIVLVMQQDMFDTFYFPTFRMVYTACSHTNIAVQQKIVFIIRIRNKQTIQFIREIPFV